MLLFSRRLAPSNPILYLDNVQISLVPTHKHLGIILSKNGNWNAHIESIIDKTSTKINLLRKFKYILDRKSLEIIYKTYIRPILEYADIVWGNTTEANDKALEDLQLAALRIITGLPRGTSHYTILREAGFVKLALRRRNHRLTMFHNIINGLAPSNLLTLAPVRRHQLIRTNLRNRNNFTLINARTNAFASSFLPHTIQEWNNLPPNIKLCTDPNAFKSLLGIRALIRPPLWYYVSVNRFIEICLTRMRHGASGLANDLFTNHIIDSPRCLCGELETADHYLIYCPMHIPERITMIQNLSSTNVPRNTITTNLLTCGSPLLPLETNLNIFKAVQIYIRATRRFV